MLSDEIGITFLENKYIFANYLVEKFKTIKDTYKKDLIFETLAKLKNKVISEIEVQIIIKDLLSENKEILNLFILYLEFNNSHNEIEEKFF